MVLLEVGAWQASTGGKLFEFNIPTCFFWPTSGLRNERPFGREHFVRLSVVLVIFVKPAVSSFQTFGFYILHQRSIFQTSIQKLRVLISFLKTAAS